MSNPYRPLEGQGPPEAYPPAYNPQYPQQPYGQQYQPPPQYPYQGYQQQPTYAAPAPAPIVVNVTNTQQQSAAPAPRPVIVQPQTVFLGRNYDNEIGPALIIFIVGFFCWCVWAAGFRYIRSKNCTAKILGIASVCMFFSGIIIAVVWIVVVTTTVNEAVKNGGGTSSYSTTYTLYTSNMYSGYSTVSVPYGYSSCTVSASSYSSWSANSQTGSTDADGYPGTTCGSGCPMYYENVMALVGKGSYSSAWQLIGDTYTTLTVYGGGSLYLGYNDVASTSSHSGQMAVTVTWYV